MQPFVGGRIVSSATQRAHLAPVHARRSNLLKLFSSVLALRGHRLLSTSVYQSPSSIPSLISHKLKCRTRLPFRNMSTDPKYTPAKNEAPPNAPQFALSSRMSTGRAMSQDVWSIFNAANLPADCINLGQGYMNFPPPQWVKEAADQALDTVAGNHYSHPKGRLRLREAIRDHYSPLYGRTLDVENEIIVSSGANEGQYAAWVAWLEPGDEVILFEPYFDQYLPSITFNHGVPVYVPLHPPTVLDKHQTSDDWKIDFEELRRAITPRTKMIVVNTPHNPVGKVFSREELQKIADVAIEHNLIVMSDEVYDGLLLDGRPHVRIATLPGMWDRTITVGSAGKSFACTGWRVGWLIGPKSLIGPTLAAQTRIVFCTNSPLQEAAAAGLEQATKRGYWKQQIDEYTERRDVLMKYFDEIGLQYSLPYGSYFVLVDISKVQIPKGYPFPETIKGRGKDFHAGWFLAQELKVSSIPVSEFYCDEHMNIGERFLRFAFCKDLDTLHKAGERLRGITKFMAQ